MVIRYKACCSQGKWKKPPVDICLHGTRGGNPDRSAEYRGTIAWVGNPNNGGVSWHVTVGDGVYAQHLPMTEWGWHAGGTSTTHIGVEFVQPTVNDPVTDAQVTAFGEWYHAVVVPAWPHLTPAALALPAHSECPQGVSDGKSDIWPRHDPRTTALRARLRAVMVGVAPGDAEDIALEAQYQQEAAMLGAKRYKGWYTRPYYSGNVLWCERGLVAPTDDQTAVVRHGLTDDIITLFEGNGWTGPH